MSAGEPLERDPGVDSFGEPYSSYGPLLESIEKELAAAHQRRREEYRNCSQLRGQRLGEIERTQQEVYELKTGEDDIASFETDVAVAKLNIEKRKEQLHLFVAKCASRQRRLREQIENVNRHKQIMEGILRDTNCDGPHGDEIPNCVELQAQMEGLETDVNTKKASIEREIEEVRENCTKNKPLYEEAVVKAQKDAAKYDDDMIKMMDAKSKREASIQNKSAELEQQQDAFEVEMKSCHEKIRYHGKTIEELQEMKFKLERLDSRESDHTADFDISLNEDNAPQAESPQPQPAFLRVSLDKYQQKLLPGEHDRFELPTHKTHSAPKSARELREQYQEFKYPNDFINAGNSDD